MPWDASGTRTKGLSASITLILKTFQADQAFRPQRLILALVGETWFARMRSTGGCFVGSPYRARFRTDVVHAGFKFKPDVIAFNIILSDRVSKRRPAADYASAAASLVVSTNAMARRPTKILDKS